MPMISHATVSAQPSTRSGVRSGARWRWSTGPQTGLGAGIATGAEIPLHYHDVEEIAVFSLVAPDQPRIGEETTVTAAPVTAFVLLMILQLSQCR
ncbi:MAG: hypothetical protein R2867_42270 [Caldilineaceae bacterium]